MSACKPSVDHKIGMMDKKMDINGQQGNKTLQYMSMKQSITFL